MRKALLTLSILLSVLALVAVAPSAAAQQETPTPGENSSESNDVRVSLDENTDVVSASLGDDTATITVRSDVRQRLEVAAITVEPGPIPPSEVFVLKAGEERTIRVPVEKVDGYALVQLYPGASEGFMMRLAEPTDMLPGSPGRNDVPVAAGTVIALLTVSVPGVLWSYGKMNGGPRREY